MLIEVVTKRFPSYELGYKDGQAGNENRGADRGKVGEKRALVRRLLNRLDIEQVATLLEVSTDEVKLIVANHDADDSKAD